MSKRWLAPAGLAAVALLVAACGSSSGSSGSGSGSNSGAAALKITSPANGAKVKTPFTLSFSSNEAIGAPSTGEDHVHLTVDGSSNYQVVDSTTTTVKNLSPGKHTIMLSLRHADHSAVGPKTSIAVTVTGGAAGTPSSSPSSGGYGY